MMKRYAEINAEWCKSCGLCIPHCPRQALQIGMELNGRGYKHVILDAEKCIGCGVCYRICPEYVFRIIENEE